ncbi:MAG: hypothetical protein L6R00_14090 [Phycisphaerae bacterium]|nr:hypothetical protein [Phycisphaerae bacterium]
MKDDDAITIATLDSAKCRRQLFWLPLLLGGLSMFPLIVGVEMLRHIGRSWIGAIVLSMGALILLFAVFLLVLLLVLRGRVVLLVRNGAVYSHRANREELLFSLDAVSEVLIWERSIVAPWTLPRRPLHPLLFVLMKPFESLPESTWRALRKNPFVSHGDIVFLDSGSHVEPMETIARRILKAAGTAQNRAIPLRRMTPAGPKAMEASDLAAAYSRQSQITVVPAGIRCAECDFDLRAQHHDYICPECGHPIARSLQGRRLEWADRPWLASVRAGTAMLAIVAPLVTAAMYWAFVLLRASGGTGAVAPLIADPLDLLPCGVGLLAIGGLLMTRRETTLAPPVPDSRSRIVCRAALAIALCATAMIAFRGASNFLLLGMVASSFVALGCASRLCARVMERAVSRRWNVLAQCVAFVNHFAAAPFLAVVLMMMLDRVLPLLGMPISVSRPPPPGPRPIDEMQMTRGLLESMFVAGIALQIVGGAAVFFKTWRTVRSALAARDEAESLDVAQGDD